MTTRLLVYYSIGFDPGFAEALDLSIASLRATATLEPDILVIIDEKFKNLLATDKVEFLKLPDCESEFDASVRKLRVFEYSRIHDYDAVAYIDSDIVVHHDIYDYLRSELDHDTLYVCRENGFENFQNVSWGLKGAKFNQAQLDFCERRNIYPFNSGFFLFRPTDVMQHHFFTAHALAHKHRTVGTYDQAAMNHYFPLHGKVNQSRINCDNYKLHYVTKNHPTINSGKLVHFCGMGTPIKQKVRAMRLYIHLYMDKDIQVPENYTDLIPKRVADWSVVTEGSGLVINLKNINQRIICNDSAAAVIAEIDGKKTVAEIADKFADAFPKSATEIREDTVQLIKDIASKGVITIRSGTSVVAPGTMRSIQDAVSQELRYWAARPGWDRNALKNGAERNRWIVASFKNGTVSMDWNGNEDSRCRVLDSYLQRIVAEAPDINGEFVINPHDSVSGNPDFPVLGFSKYCYGKEAAVLIPDVYFIHGHSGIRQTVEDAAQRTPWSCKFPKGVWRGSSTGGVNTEENWRTNLRVRLCLYSRDHPEIVDARLASFAQTTPAAEQQMREANLGPDPLPEQQQILYKYIVNVDGNSSSWGGTYWKLLSNSLMIQIGQDRDNGQFGEAQPGPIGFLQWYHHWLEPNRHFVTCSLNELSDVVRWLRKHDDEGQEMATNSTAFVHEFLTVDAGRTYFSEILKTLSRIGNGCW